MQAHLLASGVETLVHYPIPITRQAAVAGENPAECPVTDRVCDEIFSLPLYPALTDEAAATVAAAVVEGVGRGVAATSNSIGGHSPR
jgi:dTDP-4-amino-4,6-dideoxygalactose transaminase